MAVLHRKEEKIQAVLGRLPKKYSSDDFVAMFIKLYSKEWGKIKSAYIKASQDKEPGTIIHMPKPDLYLKQVLEIFLTQKAGTAIETPKEEVVKDKPVIPKTPLKKVKSDEKIAPVKKAKVALKKAEGEAIPVVKKARVTKKKAD
ncbi:hypothetical protein WG904_18350 [Pedobacter sp. Du54]|uniref:hypothetical protein n=1 Tax=Pedobacter anseongensis TaxID=3133439 RepID=UPI0030A0BA16